MKIQHGVHSFDTDTFDKWSREKFLDHFKKIKDIEGLWDKISLHLTENKDVREDDTEVKKISKTRRKKSI